jgi:thiamine-phosphate pyrophosphorylase
MKPILPRLYAIVDRAQLSDRHPAAAARELVRAGVRLFQYRDKQATSHELYEFSRAILDEVSREGVVFILNDRADIARAIGADGVHVGRNDLPVEMARAVMGPEKWVGHSTHDLDQVREAEAAPADYVAFGPIFATLSKEHPGPVVGLDGLRRARGATRKPLVAIGGITLENARQVIEAGADSVAIISDLLRAPDIGARAREFLQALGET